MRVTRVKCDIVRRVYGICIIVGYNNDVLLLLFIASGVYHFRVRAEGSHVDLYFRKTAFG